jgi:hypothetical protein
VPLEQTMNRLANRLNGRHPAIARTVAPVAHQGDERMERLGRAVSTTRAARSMTCGRLSSYDTLLQRLAQDLEDMAAALGQLIQEEHTIEARKTSPCRGKGPALIVRTGWRHGGTTPRWRRV